MGPQRGSRLVGRLRRDFEFVGVGSRSVGVEGRIVVVAVVVAVGGAVVAESGH